MNLEGIRTLLPDFQIEWFDRFDRITSLRWRSEWDDGGESKHLMLTMTGKLYGEIILEFFGVESFSYHGDGQIGGFYIRDMLKSGYEKHARYQVGNYENEENTISFFCRDVVVRALGAVSLEEMQADSYTYFAIEGIFDPDRISEMLGLTPHRSHQIGDMGKTGTLFERASWDFGLCKEYDVIVSNQMMKTIAPLLPKIEILNKIKRQFEDVEFTLVVVPTVVVGKATPCLAPSPDVMRFCLATGTEIDIDLYAYDA